MNLGEKLGAEKETVRTMINQSHPPLSMKEDSGSMLMIEQDRARRMKKLLSNI